MASRGWWADPTIPKPMVFSKGLTEPCRRGSQRLPIRATGIRSVHTSCVHKKNISLKDIGFSSCQSKFSAFQRIWILFLYRKFVVPYLAACISTIFDRWNLITHHPIFQCIKQVLFSMRTQKHGSTRCTPFRALFGREGRHFAEVIHIHVMKFTIWVTKSCT